jgi:hypothetical protein
MAGFVFPSKKKTLPAGCGKVVPLDTSFSLEEEPRNPILKQLNLFEAGIHGEYRPKSL